MWHGGGELNKGPTAPKWRFFGGTCGGGVCVLDVETMRRVLKIAAASAVLPVPAAARTISETAAWNAAVAGEGGGGGDGKETAVAGTCGSCKGSHL